MSSDIYKHVRAKKPNAEDRSVGEQARCARERVPRRAVVRRGLLVAAVELRRAGAGDNEPAWARRSLLGRGGWRGGRRRGRAPLHGVQRRPRPVVGPQRMYGVPRGHPCAEWERRLLGVHRRQLRGRGVGRVPSLRGREGSRTSREKEGNVCGGRRFRGGKTLSRCSTRRGSGRRNRGANGHRRTAKPGELFGGGAPRTQISAGRLFRQGTGLSDYGAPGR